MGQRKAFWLGLLSLALVCLYPCLFQFTSNAPESVLADAALFFGIFLAIGILVFLGGYLLLRQWGAAGLLADAVMLVVINGGLLTGALKARGIQARYPLAVLLLLLVALLVLLKRKGWKCQTACVLVALMFGGLSLVSLGMGAPAMVRELRQNAARAPGREAKSIEKQGGPNVYLYLYDEYGGPENLRYFYDYDSSGFYRELEQRGFNCSADSYNTESCATVQLVPDLLDLSYEVPPYFASGDGSVPRLYVLFQDMGYQVNLINHTDFLDTDGARVLTQNQHRDSIAVYLYQNSLLKVAYPLFERLPQLRQLNESAVMALDALDCMEDAWRYTDGKPGGDGVHPQAGGQRHRTPCRHPSGPVSESEEDQGKNHTARAAQIPEGAEGIHRSIGVAPVLCQGGQTLWGTLLRFEGETPRPGRPLRCAGPGRGRGKDQPHYRAYGLGPGGTDGPTRGSARPGGAGGAACGVPVGRNTDPHGAGTGKPYYSPDGSIRSVRAWLDAQRPGY